MAKIVEIHLPDEIAHYEGDLRYFFDSMVRKLYANRHKGFAENDLFEDLYKGLQDEAVEMLQAVQSEPQFSAYMETVDIANYGFLLGLYLSRLTKEEYKELAAS